MIYLLRFSKGEFYVSSLQDFVPKNKYSVMWIQWVCMYLTDVDLVNVLKRFQSSLTENGFAFLFVSFLCMKFELTLSHRMIIIKENMLVSGLRPYKVDEQVSYFGFLIEINSEFIYHTRIRASRDPSSISRK